MHGAGRLAASFDPTGSWVLAAEAQDLGSGQALRLVKTTYEPAGAEAWRECLESRRLTASVAELVLWLPLSGHANAITRADAYDEAMCCGWRLVGGHPIDTQRIAVRFAVRGPEDPWAPEFLARARELRRMGRMTPAGAATLPAPRNGD